MPFILTEFAICIVLPGYALYYRTLDSDQASTLCSPVMGLLPTSAIMTFSPVYLPSHYALVEYVLVSISGLILK